MRVATISAEEDSEKLSNCEIRGHGEGFISIVIFIQAISDILVVWRNTDTFLRYLTQTLGRILQSHTHTNTEK